MMNEKTVHPRTLGARPGHPALDIESLVRAVLSSLGVPHSKPLPTAPASQVDPSSARIIEEDNAVHSVPAELKVGPVPVSLPARHEAEVFADRLLAQRHIEALPGGTREVRITPGTVVTPLARDLLKRRGIILRWVSGGEAGRVRDRGEWGFAFESESGVLAALRRAWLEEEWSEVASSPVATARWVVASPRRGALLLTDEASVAVWRACRFEGVRAASAAEPEAVARAVRRLGVNLLVVEPAGKSIALMRQLGRTFRRGGAPRAPEGLASAGEARP
ncbi:MAG: hypothetical protein JO284_09975 [Planctomycetaceae bacterium]|nr:hypothetical protein [Planctomycetaceae bacterium]MBV8314644.1 hypothetical protein [Planctomycetaceae bacterium]